MQTHSERPTVEPVRDRAAGVLRLVGWLSFWVQLGLAIVAGLMIGVAIGGGNFSRALTPSVATPNGVVPASTTPGISIGMIWAVCGILVLLFNAYLAFRQTRLAARLRRPHSDAHPSKAETLQLLRLGVITGLIGLIVAILGCGATLGVLLSKSIAQPQGVAIYDPNRVIRSLDIFVAMANMDGIVAHFIGMLSFLGVSDWLHRQ
jgi:hypothetical protein